MSIPLVGTTSRPGAWPGRGLRQPKDSDVVSLNFISVNAPSGLSPEVATTASSLTNVHFFGPDFRLSWTTRPWLVESLSPDLRHSQIFSLRHPDIGRPRKAEKLPHFPHS